MYALMYRHLVQSALMYGHFVSGPLGVLFHYRRIHQVVPLHARVVKSRRSPRGGVGRGDANVRCLRPTRRVYMVMADKHHPVTVQKSVII